MKCFIAAALIGLALFGNCSFPLLGQGTAFTYQGSLKENNAPANGVYDLTFSLYNVATGGTPEGGTQLVNAIGVTNGLFTVQVDFGSPAFTSGDRWLEIAARPAGGGSYILLTPRQKITPAPQAIFANAANAGTLIGTIRADNLASGIITSSKLASNAITSVNIANGSITPDKFATNEFLALSPVGELHVNSISTNPPAVPLNGNITIETPNLGPATAYTVSILEMAKTEVELNEVVTVDDTTRSYQTGFRIVTPLKIRKYLTSDTTWKRWVSATIDRVEYHGTLTIALDTGQRIILGEAFPVTYQVGHGHDGNFYETMTVQAETYLLQN